METSPAISLEPCTKHREALFRAISTGTVIVSESREQLFLRNRDQHPKGGNFRPSREHVRHYQDREACLAQGWFSKLRSNRLATPSGSVFDVRSSPMPPSSASRPLSQSSPPAPSGSNHARRTCERCVRSSLSRAPSACRGSPKDS
jgi:hypothetical protein